MFLRCHTRRKNGKEHHYWSIAESKRVAGNRTVQRHVLYLGEINDSQQAAWRKTIEVFGSPQAAPQTLALFPQDHPLTVEDAQVVRIRLDELSVQRPRQWGACWLASVLYQQLGLDQFWAGRLPPSRKGTRWDLVLQALVTYRLISPGSEWRLHRQWFEHSALGDLLGSDFGLVDSHKLYECHDLLLAHKSALFSHLTQQWKDLFNAKFEVLLYDLTSTYFESEPPFPEGDKRRHGYSRDKRPDCVQVVVALILTPEGFPLAYEVMAGNTSDKTTLKEFLKRIEQQYGVAERIWIMDRGIPTEETLAAMRQSPAPVYYLVGTPKGRLSALEKALVQRPWQVVREGVAVKLLPQEGELYVFAQSADRVAKERAMRRRQLKTLWQRLKQLQRAKQPLSRDELLLKLGGAKQQAPSAWRLVEVVVPEAGQQVNAQTFRFGLRKDKLRAVRRREGRYLLRTNLVSEDPAKLWELYMLLVMVEEAFRNLKGDLGLRPIYHQKENRIEAHIFVAFVAYCLHVTLRRRLRDLAPGLTPRAVLEKFATMQMVDVHLPTTDGRVVILLRTTQPEKDVQILLRRLKLELPKQPPPRITNAEAVAPSPKL
jgi:transposase